MNKVAYEDTSGAERIRQEQETFDQRKNQDARWFCLRLTMGYIAVLLLIAIFFFCSFILYNYPMFPDQVVKASSAVLFTDVIGLATFIWKFVLSQNSTAKLEPVTYNKIRGKNRQ